MLLKTEVPNLKTNKPMKFRSLLAIIATIVVALFQSATSTLAQPIGQWDFENGNLAGTIGDGLQGIGDTEASTEFGTTTSFGLPDINGQAANIMKFPANITPQQGYYLYFFAAPNGGGGRLNQWTIIFDILFPAESTGKRRGLLETDGRTTPDADLFVDSSGGLGVSGRYGGQILSNTWYRVGFVVDATTNQLRKYINGVLVGTQPATSGATPALDGRWSLDTLSGTIELFNDDNGEAAVGYVNSIQLRDAALTTGQMIALGGPSATGIPQEIPPVPSYVEKWIPSTATVSRDTDLGVVLNTGDTTIEDSSISLRLNGQLLTGVQITRDGPVITVLKSDGAPLAVPANYNLEVTYTDSAAGQRTFSQSFAAVVFIEDFNSLALGPNVEESLTGTEVWTEVPPTGWTIDDSGVPGAGTDNDGIREWAGWSFADFVWWHTTAGNQNRANFTKATGAVAIADPDEWDDSSHEPGMFNAYMSTPPMALEGLAPNSVTLRFDSSWRDECCDDNPALDNSQTATVEISYDGGDFIEVMKWDSTPGSPFFHDDNENETVILRIDNPAGANTMVLRFGLTRAENDWWWAVDNILVQAGAVAPVITTPPRSQLASFGGTVNLSVVASGAEPFGYRWQLNGADLAGATASTLSVANVQTAGDYRVIVSNAGGAVTSQVARVEVFNGPITQDLVVHLKLDGDFVDASGRDNNAAAVGAPTFSTGKVGASAIHIPSGQDYVTLGAPADLNFSTNVDFTIAFWAKVIALSSDPSLVGNKDWNSGGNPGYVIFTTNEKKVRWNVAGQPGERRDGSEPTGSLSDNQWHHVAVVFDRDGDVSIYVDGSLRHGAAMSPVPNDFDTPVGYNTNLGQDGTGSYGPAFSDADMDDVGFWRRRLSVHEIASIYSQGLLGFDLSTAAGTPPSITNQPVSQLVSAGGNVNLSVGAGGPPPFTYQWQKDSVNLNGATSASFAINGAQSGNSGDYRVIVSNSAGSVTSQVARVTVFAGPVNQDLVAWLKFDGNFRDSSGHANHGTAVGSPTFASGRVGQAAFISVSGDASVRNYVTLGYPPDLRFGAGDFSVAFWTSFTNQSSDPTFISNKDWDSSSNIGWGVFAQGGGNIRINATGTPAGSGNRMNTTSTPVIRDGAWHHVAVSFWRGGKLTSTYVDGALVNVSPLAIAGSVDTVNQGFAVNIGQDGTGLYAALLEALMDEVQLWRRALTPQDVAALHGKGLAGQDAFVSVTSLTPSGSDIIISWSGGTGPFVVERKSALTDGTWTEVTTTPNRTVTVPRSGLSGFIRVRASQ